MQVEFLPSGDTGLTVQFGHDIDRRLNAQVLCLQDLVARAQIPGVLEMVPTYRSLLIHYDPLALRQSELIAKLQPIISTLDDGTERNTGPYSRWTIPACFEPDYAEDLQQVAQALDLSSEAIIRHMIETEHYVYMLGFAPGQPYMGDLPTAMNIPRRKDPIPSSPKGSILTATGLTVIYPVAAPTGWHRVGRTPISLFAMERDPVILLSPRDRVCFSPISAQEFEVIEAQDRQTPILPTREVLS